MARKDESSKDEQRDFELFCTFNNRSKYKRLFSPTDLLTRWDIESVKLSNLQEERIELKWRDKSFLTAEDIFIEPWKYAHLMDYWNNEGYLPIYINFFGDADDVWLWILPEFDKNKLHKHEKV